MATMVVTKGLFWREFLSEWVLLTHDGSCMMAVSLK